MQDIVKRVLTRYGQMVTLDGAAGYMAFQGVFQHTGSKDWHNMEKAYMPLGQIPRGQYMILAPAGVILTVGDKLTVGTRRFAIRRAEEVSWMNQVLYSWGLCVELGGADTWPA